MPIYEFRCKKCANQIEVFQKMSDKPPARCKKCGGRLERVISAPAIQFKGAGWYVTDYARKDQGVAAPKPEASNKTDTDKPASDDKTKDKPAAAAGGTASPTPTSTKE